MTRRRQTLEALHEQTFDALVVGGGVNGAISALALASHGVSVALMERNDFASGTSQHSSNLVWGGFKYLANYEFGLVSGLCASRNRMAAAFPNRVVEKRFFAALDKSSPFPPWFAALGANAYWALGRFATKRPCYRSLQKIRELEPVLATTNVRGGIEYSDTYLPDNDSRFVSEMVLQAEAAGATVCNYLTIDELGKTEQGWAVRATDKIGGNELRTTARTLINAAGPNATGFADSVDAPTESRTVFSKGVHFVVPQITNSGRVLAFYDDSQRLFYVFPMGHRSVIGTTDTPTENDDEPVTDKDREFVLDQINKRLSISPLTKDDIIAERCGVRTLVLTGDESVEDRDWVDLSRKHVVEVDQDAQVISILGGKLSDCLNVGEEVVEAVERLGNSIHAPPADWYGEPSAEEADRFTQRAAALGLDRPNRFDVADTFAETLWRRHGLRANEILDLVAEQPSLGESLTELADMCEAEVVVMRRHEKIEKLDDFLRRRTNLAQLNTAATISADEGVKRAAEVVLGRLGVSELAGIGNDP